RIGIYIWIGFGLYRRCICLLFSIFPVSNLYYHGDLHTESKEGKKQYFSKANIKKILLCIKSFSFFADLPLVLSNTRDFMKRSRKRIKGEAASIVNVYNYVNN